MSVKVRGARERDAADIARVHVDAWRGTYRGLLPDEVLDALRLAKREEQWRERLRCGRPEALVAEIAGAVAGFVTIEVPARDADEAETVGEIPALYVAPAAWRAGAGAALITAAVARMRSLGCDGAILWMLAGNDRAARFYERMGWTDDSGRRPSQYFPGIPGLVEVRFRRRIEPS